MRPGNLHTITYRTPYGLIHGVVLAHCRESTNAEVKITPDWSRIACKAGFGFDSESYLFLITVYRVYGFRNAAPHTTNMPPDGTYRRWYTGRKKIYHQGFVAVARIGGIAFPVGANTYALSLYGVARYHALNIMKISQQMMLSCNYCITLFFPCSSSHHGPRLSFCNAHLLIDLSTVKPIFSV
jgi:hypothetical protein